VYRWIEHTAELELAIDAPTREAVFEDALAAFAELTRDPAAGGEPATKTIALEAADQEALLADWLSELVFLAETEDFVPQRIDELVLREQSLEAVVRGRRGHPAPLVKAVTYHGLELREEADGWRASIVLDV
jgi:SHS2 domain-containing protein